MRATPSNELACQMRKRRTQSTRPRKSGKPTCLRGGLGPGGHRREEPRVCWMRRRRRCMLEWVVFRQLSSCERPLGSGRSSMPAVARVGSEHLECGPWPLVIRRRNFFRWRLLPPKADSRTRLQSPRDP